VRYRSRIRVRSELVLQTTQVIRSLVARSTKSPSSITLCQATRCKGTTRARPDVRRIRLVSLLLLAGVALAGCSADSEGSSARFPESWNQTILSPVPPQAGEWRVEGVTADGRELTIRYYHGDPECFALDEVSVEETADAVSISVTLKSRRSRLGVCRGLLTSDRARVELERPLGQRRLIDSGR
jgi:hypothetical protein